MSLLIIYNIYSSCEYEYINHNISKIENINNSELVNSLTSLPISLLGLIGLFSKNTYFYMINMNLLIILGLSSMLHHYFYNNKYFWKADIISIEMIILFIQLYLFNVCNSNSINNLNKLKQLYTLLNFLLMIIYNSENISIRTTIIQFNIGLIILKQIYSCYYIYKINDKNFGLFLKSNIVNLIYLLLATLFWYLDKLCIHDLHKIINSHGLWHIFISFAIFNTININIIYISIINKKTFNIYTLSYRLPYLTYIIIIKNIKISTCSTATYMELKDILVNNINLSKNHRRNLTYG